VNWSDIAARLDADGCAVLPGLLSPEECAAVRDDYGNEALFRKRIVMQSHGYGRGEYQYFAYPLPARIAAMRSALYPPFADIANGWNEAMRVETRYPAEHAAYLEACHLAGQTRPTPRRRRIVRPDSPSPARSWSPTRTRPAVGTSSPPIRPSRVDFPHPLGPAIATLLPGSTAKVTPSSARTMPLGVA